MTLKTEELQLNPEEYAEKVWWEGFTLPENPTRADAIKYILSLRLGNTLNNFTLTRYTDEENDLDQFVLEPDRKMMGDSFMPMKNFESWRSGLISAAKFLPLEIRPDIIWIERAEKGVEIGAEEGDFGKHLVMEYVKLPNEP